MMNMSGMTISEIRSLASKLRGQANELESVRKHVDSAIQTAQKNWAGRDFDNFRILWTSDRQPKMRTAIAVLNERASTMDQQASDQEKTSAANKSAVSAGLLIGGFPYSPEKNNGDKKGNSQQDEDDQSPPESHTPGSEPSQDVIDKFQTDDDPDGQVIYAPFFGWFGEQQMTQHEANMLDRMNLFDQWTVKRIGDEALDFQFGHNDVSDAMRHAYWNARLTQRFGEDWTREYTTAHEGTPDPDELLKCEEVMDLYNNDVGIRIALEHPNATPDELKAYIQEAVDNGQLLVINQIDPDNPRLEYS